MNAETVAPVNEYGLTGEVRKLVPASARVLREQAAKAGKYGEHLHKLVADLLATMRAHKGIGLAAPQVGVSDRVAVVELPPRLHLVLVNPVIVDRGGRRETRIEGCLSLPGVEVPVERYVDIIVEATDERGRYAIALSGLAARAVQHEVDHLNGILITDPDVKRREFLP